MNTKIALISALAPISIAAAFTLTTPAKAIQLADACHGNKKQVLSCCAAWVKSRGTPMWMEQSGASCGSAVVCTGGGGGGSIAKIVSYSYKKGPETCMIQPISPQTPSSKTTTTSGGGGNYKH